MTAPDGRVRTVGYADDCPGGLAERSVVWAYGRLRIPLTGVGTGRRVGPVGRAPGRSLSHTRVSVIGSGKRPAEIHPVVGGYAGLDTPAEVFAALLPSGPAAIEHVKILIRHGIRTHGVVAPEEVAAPPQCSAARGTATAFRPSVPGGGTPWERARTRRGRLG
ncbi:hypothetical protein U5640_42815 [Streptomyces sp. SS7]|uniref:hypothetical protein n=1 Tax=Streptomyces sp. SS7 TaxID=3108485 RepID=UPI0030EC745D